MTAEAEFIFPKAYALVLSRLLDTLDERAGPQMVRALLQETGRQIADEQHLSYDEFPARLDGAVRLLNQLGGLADVEEQNGALAIQCYSCPLETVVSRHPDLCKLTESLLTALVGIPIQEQCARDDRPRCRFAIARR
jgi:predicted ArsR family transcriptional regulator